MRFIDGNDGQVYTLPDLWRDWQAFRKEDPDNHAPSFKIVFPAHPPNHNKVNG